MKSSSLLSSLFGAATLAGALCIGISLSAQDMPQSQPQQPQSQSSQAPDNSGQTAPPASATGQSAAPQPNSQSASGVQVFSGTILKSGDKYVLQDASTGTSYDLDQQEPVAKYEGKKVRVHGTLDPNGKMIHIQ